MATRVHKLCHPYWPLLNYLGSLGSFFITYNYCTLKRRLAIKWKQKSCFVTLSNAVVHYYIHKGSRHIADTCRKGKTSQLSMAYWSPTNHFAFQRPQNETLIIFCSKRKLKSLLPSGLFPPLTTHCLWSKWEYITPAAKCKLSLWEGEGGGRYTNVICRHSNMVFVLLCSVIDVHITQWPYHTGTWTVGS